MELEESALKKSSDAQVFDSQFRFDPATGLWALIADGRADRPHNVNGTSDEACVFCPGSEEQTPKLALAAVAKNDVADPRSLDEIEILEPSDDPKLARRPWFARVVENKYPSFRLDATSAPAPTLAQIEAASYANERDAVPTSVRARGLFEVIVDSPRCVRDWSEFSEFQIKVAFRVFRARLRALRATGLFENAFVFKNVGADAGASQRHTHSQLVGNVESPPSAREETRRVAALERARLARGERKSYWDALLDEEIRLGERVVYVGERFVALCPRASRFPLQTDIIPRFADAFEDYDDAAVDELALLSRRLVSAYRAARRRLSPNEPDRVDHNVVMRNPVYRDACLDVAPNERSRARWSFLPSLVKKAGYELGSNIDINPVAPERAAKILRDVAF